MNTLLLDIDGTINAFSGRPPKRNTHWTGDWSREKVAGEWVLWSHELVEALTQLSSRDNLRIVWLTDWRRMALEFGAAVGLPEFDYIDATEDEVKPDAADWWKLPHAKKSWLDSSKVVWLDDGIQYHPKSHWWELGRDRLLTISPNQYHGLTRKHMEKVNEFLDS